jgi:hypothetical protein
MAMFLSAFPEATPASIPTHLSQTYRIIVGAME